MPKDIYFFHNLLIHFFSQITFLTRVQNFYHFILFPTLIFSFLLSHTSIYALTFFQVTLTFSHQCCIIRKQQATHFACIFSHTKFHFPLSYYSFLACSKSRYININFPVPCTVTPCATSQNNQCTNGPGTSRSCSCNANFIPTDGSNAENGCDCKKSDFYFSYFILTCSIRLCYGLIYLNDFFYYNS